MKHMENEIGINLKRIRETRNLSLDKLSDLTGVSKSMLRQIEMGKSSPTIATIWKIANGLRVSFTALLKEDQVEAEIKDYKSEEPLTAESNHYRLFPLIPFDPQRSFETYYIEIDPDTTFEGEPHEGDVIEYVFVTKGELQIQVDQKELKAGKDQFISFQANRPHFYTCIGNKTTTALMMISYL